MRRVEPYVKTFVRLYHRGIPLSGVSGVLSELGWRLSHEAAGR